MSTATITSISQSNTVSSNDTSSEASSENKLPVIVEAKKEPSPVHSNVTSHTFFIHRGKEPPEPAADPKTSDILAGRETTIELAKEKIGLGLSIVGGSDTPLVINGRFEAKNY